MKSAEIVSLDFGKVGSGRSEKVSLYSLREGGCEKVKKVPGSMSLGHALDWEELAAGERPG